MFSERTDLATRAQSVLNDLWAENLIPFPLKAHKVESLGLEEYIVRFYDSRMRSVDLSWKNFQSFEDAFRTVVLDRVARLPSPLRANPNKEFRFDLTTEIPRASS
jgi:hypothetical protein